MIEVYHLNDADFFDETSGSFIGKKNLYIDVNIGIDPERQQDAAVQLFNDGFYKLVAKVGTSDLDKAWEKTNSIESSWIKNLDVYPIRGDTRSSKVGDIMKDAFGDYYIVSSLGFIKTPVGAINPR